MGTKRASLLLSLGIAFLSFVPAMARADNAALFNNLLQNPGHQNSELAAIKKSQQWIGSECADSALAYNGNPVVYTPPQFDVRGEITAGLWKESFVANECGRQRQFNVLSQVTGPNYISMEVLLPGATQVPPTFEKKAIGAVKQAIAPAIPRGCSEGFIYDTAYIGPEVSPPDVLPSENALQPWQEEWTLNLCHQWLQAIVHFVPNRNDINIYVTAK